VSEDSIRNRHITVRPLRALTDAELGALVEVRRCIGPLLAGERGESFGAVGDLADRELNERAFEAGRPTPEAAQ
jgi:hypothetical protein